MHMKKATLILALMLTSNLILAQEEGTKTPPATTFAGSADAYYKYDFANDFSNNKTSFTNSSNSFELGMASIEASHKFGKASVFVDLGFGKRAADFSYNDTSPNDNATFLIKQLNFTYEFSDTFKIIAGSFATHVGYELVDAVDNKNYSMSYAFTYGPFFNTGVKAIYTTGKVNFMFGVVNPTDFKTAIEASSNQKSFIGQIGYTEDTGSAFLNFTSGSMNNNVGSPLVSGLNQINKTQFDFVASKKIGDAFNLGLNATYAIVNSDVDSSLDGNWFSVVGYAGYKFNDATNINYRLEFFDDKDGVAAFGSFGGANVFSNTMSLNYKVGNLTFIPEVRFDFASEKIYPTENNASKTNGSILFATTYSF